MSDTPNITMSPVQSSNVQAAGYDPISQTMAVQFKGGATYHYAGVPPQLGAELGTVASVGSFVSQRIVKGGFAATKVG